VFPDFMYTLYMGDHAVTKEMMEGAEMTQWND
jgi:hypothetical protein